MNLLLFFLLSTVSVFAVVSGTVEETARDVIDALAHAPFEEWSSVFIETNDRIRAEVIPSTLFIPNSSANGSDDRHKLASYHIVPQRLEFADLLLKPSRSRLPTLLNGSSILVTNNSATSFSIDGVLIIELDIYVDSFIAIHRIAYPLDYTTYGGGSKLISKWPLFTFMLVTVVWFI
ncbi:putative FAS1 domain-containing protein [Arabidopsis thaliana]|uniref:Fasciclin-like arabinogalactan family protein n=4 Tax=Arabidopsis TaxID=3701 RepID=Q9SV74_ARATH|nr:Fasciclin-like arabinogalactan family protein [Arabidopsis thaliana]KAG7615756.1 FAS1 domain [Arabidopsis thaliana x Arabidopsis arenosa]ABE65522.1 hypothetical protein At4g12950 [Arabidopsis thaliana]AEE83206.1 Fasciclin-like arabinogalactan family protein [Arabidopsis thaliana]OAO96797.1 hypothetical protein AXX17_AT4G14600 [Arabidopsis thaliana]CAA0395022.1 unnamed protein product [Arabidopsis thaliana]|eukprot:NP_193031.1 Fasciclin-like arabinogalactan family protein [Arabidopsis thaliana]